jgi:hypothetical protein
MIDTNILSKMCHYSQDNIRAEDMVDGEFEKPENQRFRASCLACTSYAVACFIAQNTVAGHSGVESDIVLEELVEGNVKSIEEWEVIIQEVVDLYDGWYITA